MKRQLLLITACLLTVLGLRAQPLRTCRYWYDRDIGDAVTTSFSGNTGQLQLNVDALAEGLHTLHLQVADTSQNWGATKSFMFMKPEDYGQENLSYRCWFDQDYDSYVTGNLGDGTFFLNVSEFKSGMHTMHLVLEGSTMTSTKSYLFMKPEDYGLENLSYRCWFDQDYDSYVTGNLGDGTFFLNVSEFKSGMHTMHLVLEGSTMTSTKSYLFMKPEDYGLENLTYRFWFDFDIENQQIGSFENGSWLLDVSDLRDGIHTLHLQLEGSTMTSAKSYLFMKVPAVEDCQYRCWFDEDDSTVLTGPVIGGAFLLDVTALSMGQHVLFLQLSNGSFTSPRSYFFYRGPAVMVSAIPVEGGTAAVQLNDSLCTITATANQGYTFVNWTENGNQVSTSASHSFVVSDGDDDRTFVANFMFTGVNYIVNALANPAEGGTVEGAGTYVEGTTCTLTATANQGYAFVNWTENGSQVSDNPNYSFTVTSNRTFVANFTVNAINYTVNATANPAEGGTVEGAGTYPEGATCTLTATANEGYTFVNWTNNGNEVSTNPIYVFTVTEAGTYVANFSQNNYTITATANPTEGGTVTGAGTYSYGATCTLTATANTGYTFVNWTKDGAAVSTTATYSFEVTEAASYVANFESNDDDPLIYSINDDGISVTVIGHVDGTAATGTLTIPEIKTIAGITYTVTAIGDSAFYYCNNLTGNLTIPNSVTIIGASAFKGCGHFTGSLIIPNSVIEIGDNAFAYCYGFTGNLTLGNSIITIGNHAFQDCYFTGSLIIPNSVITIGNCAFIDCNHFTGSLTIGDSVTTIGDSAFRRCGHFTGNLIIGNSVTTIGDAAFLADCRFTGSLIIPNSVTYIGIQAFGACSGFTGSLTIPNSVTTIGYSAFDECSGFTGSLTISNSLTTIEWAVFRDCSGFTGSLTIPNSVTAIDGNAFLGCSGFTGDLSIPDSVIEIGNGAFSNCIGFTGSLILGNSVTIIRENAFSGCSGFTGSLTIPNSVISIRENAFDECSGFTGSLTIGNSLTEIRQYAFNNCSGFTSIQALPESAPLLGNNVFEGVNHAIPVTVPCGSLSSYQNATGWSEFTNWHELCQYEITATASPTEGGTVTGTGSYAEGETCTLTALANEGYVFVNWTKNDEVVSTEVVYSFTVTEDATFVANFITDESHWSVNIHQYPYNMTVTGIIQIYGEEQRTTALEIGAFCNDECRGSQRLTYFQQSDHYLVFLTLYGEGGDILSFRLYDHVLGEELDLACTSTIAFVPDGSMGTAFEPYVFDFGDMTIEQVSNFSQGYNWWSTCIEQEGIDGLSMLQDGLDSYGISIRSQASGYNDYYAGYGWFGSLAGINNESSYRVITNLSCTVTMTGTAAVPSEHPITLSQGWTWMGYVPSTVLDINVAMAGIDASVGDMLKSQQGYSDYYPGYGWYGSLNTIEPGMGLMYYSTNSEPVTFTYPDSSRGGELRANITAEHNHWKPNTYAYPDNMTVTAVVELDDEELNTENYELAMFSADGECRGSVKLVYAEPLHRHVAFLTVSGKDAAELSFRLYDTETGTEYYDAEESLGFVANAIVGEATDLYVIHFRGMSSLDEFAKSVQVYPNPINRGERFSINMNAESKTPVRVEIIDALGVETLRATTAQMPVTLTAPATAGVYTLHITLEGKGTLVRKLVVK